MSDKELIRRALMGGRAGAAGMHKTGNRASLPVLR